MATPAAVAITFKALVDAARKGTSCSRNYLSMRSCDAGGFMACIDFRPNAMGTDGDIIICLYKFLVE